MSKNMLTYMYNYSCNYSLGIPKSEEVYYRDGMYKEEGNMTWIHCLRLLGRLHLLGWIADLKIFVHVYTGPLGIPQDTHREG